MFCLTTFKRWHLHFPRMYLKYLASLLQLQNLFIEMVWVVGYAPARSAWKAEVLLLYYTHFKELHFIFKYNKIFYFVNLFSKNNLNLANSSATLFSENFPEIFYYIRNITKIFNFSHFNFISVLYLFNTMLFSYFFIMPFSIP